MDYNIEMLFENLNKTKWGKDESCFWRRPCFKDFKKVIIGDSMIRSFGKKRYLMPGYSINGYGGLKLMELIHIILRGSLPRMNLNDAKNRADLISGKEVIQHNRTCAKCRNECAADFEGDLVIVCGINNSLHGADVVNLKMNVDKNVYESNQDIEGTFKLLDMAIQKAVPKAKVTFALNLDTNDPTWAKTNVCQDIFNKINGQIRQRKHVEVDTKLPLKMRWISNTQYDKVHFANDFDGINFWKMIFDQV